VRMQQPLQQARRLQPIAQPTGSRAALCPCSPPEW
jgi:hypothetical protein